MCFVFVLEKKQTLWRPQETFNIPVTKMCSKPGEKKLNRYCERKETREANKKKKTDIKQENEISAEDTPADLCKQWTLSHTRYLVIV